VMIRAIMPLSFLGTWPCIFLDCKVLRACVCVCVCVPKIDVTDVAICVI
jgi:hypothetical protein